MSSFGIIEEDNWKRIPLWTGSFTGFKEEDSLTNGCVYRLVEVDTL